MKPIVGIVADSQIDPADPRTGGTIKLNYNYAEQITQAGGNPVLLTPCTDVAQVAPMLDGWLIPGGDDIDARHFGQQNHPEANLVDPARFEAERRLYAAVDPELPILGICYGCQFLGVMHGGTLDQHLPDRLGTDEHITGTLQEYALEPSSRLAGLVGSNSVHGKSYHHQALDQIGHGLKVVGRHADGTIEAVESTSRPWLFGVQWHPERTPNDEATRRLFGAFIEASRAFAARKPEGALT
ncbi:MAG TPA: gamma-glutamyl-gamma-aminobutyrate hydrolase family protein [Fimbriimonadaceae bacterium]|nr:gamma-glutamyl-gamma-aminobutyrate hydrolase family protein [Fimbriimonadaceae bacterium]HRJ96181.1 gamma-glutamyl-gamma-aminobutyrate hydrolase family protein [Fimbriimonadaceae bacterium]